MPVSTNELLTSMSTKLSSAPIVGKVTRNPFYTALFIAVIIILIVLFVFRNEDFDEDSEGLPKLAIRSGVYSLFIVTAIQFMQNQNIMDEVKSGGRNEKLDKIFSNSDVRGVKVREEPIEQTTNDTIIDNTEDIIIPKSIDVSFM